MSSRVPPFSEIEPVTPADFVTSFLVVWGPAPPPPSHWVKCLREAPFGSGKVHARDLHWDGKHLSIELVDEEDIEAFALQMPGWVEYANAPAGTLAQGDDRRLGVARALATEPTFVLMDEPAAGLPEAEVPEFADVVRSVRDDHDAGVLLIDHNMALIMDVCDRIQVLDMGRTLAEGTPGEIRVNLDVAAAYLGDSAVHEDET